MASVRKRSWTYQGVEKTAWVVSYTDAKGKRRQRTCPSKKIADGLKLKVMNELADGTHLALADTITVRMLGDMYLHNVEDRVRDGRLLKGSHVTIRNQVECIDKHLGHLKLTAVTMLHLEEFYRTLVRGEGLAPKTAKTRVHVFGQMAEYAIRRGFLKLNPATGALRELRGVEAGRVRTFNPEEMSRLLAETETKRWRGSQRTLEMVRLIVFLAAFCGLRYGEIMGLKRENVDLKARLIRVRHSLSLYDGLKAPKTKAGIRDVPMPGNVAELLEAWIARRYIENPDKLVIRSKYGERIKHSSFSWQMWIPLLRRAGLGKEGDQFHFHALRHWYASNLVAHNVPITDVANLLGHAKFDETLEVYAHPLMAPARRHAAVEAMAEGLSAAVTARVAEAHRRADAEDEPAPFRQADAAGSAPLRPGASPPFVH